MSGIERQRELRRRRKRRKKLDIIGRKVKTASVSDKQNIAQKLRRMTPGADAIIERLGLKS